MRGREPSHKKTFNHSRRGRKSAKNCDLSSFCLRRKNYTILHTSLSFQRGPETHRTFTIRQQKKFINKKTHNPTNKQTLRSVPATQRSTPANRKIYLLPRYWKQKIRLIVESGYNTLSCPNISLPSFFPIWHQLAVPCNAITQALVMYIYS